MEIKELKNYYQIIADKFPNVPQKDIETILNYGWRSLYLHNSYGGDTLIRDNKFWCYIGFLKKNSLEYFKYYIKKLTIKLRVQYKKQKTQWDGFYYFALTDPQYLEYLNQQNKKGRKRKNFNYGNQILYKLLDECKLNKFNRKYIFKIPYKVDLGFTFYCQNLTTSEAELIETRNIQKFKDILVSNFKYNL